MARSLVTLECRIAWWVRPYLWSAALFARSVEPFLAPDDDRLDEFVTRQVEFVTRHGVRFYCDGRRV